MAVHQFPQQMVAADDLSLPFFASLLGDDDAEVHCDGTYLSFVKPVGICALAAVCHELSLREQAVHFDALPPHLDSFFERMDVFHHCHVEHHDTRSRIPREESLVEVRRLERLEDVSGTATRLAQAMTGHLFYDIPDEEDPDGMYARPSLETMNLLRYVLAELLENALTHARSEGFGGASVWVAANYYRSTGELCLAVVDNGCGFLRSLGQHPNVRIHPSDALAIRTALEPFVSRNRAVGILNAPSNQGIGLTMSRDIVVKSDGIVSITSGSGSVWDHQYGRSSWERRLPWQGAIIDAKLRRDALLNIALADIASQYHQAIKPNLLYE